jgi:hypothetical protein
MPKLAAVPIPGIRLAAPPSADNPAPAQSPCLARPYASYAPSAAPTPGINLPIPLLAACATGAAVDSFRTSVDSINRILASESATVLFILESNISNS